MWGCGESCVCPARVLAAVAVGAAVQIIAPNAAAEPVQPKYGWREVWAGSDAMRDVWLIYSGVTLAPWSEHIYEPGVRLRSHVGYGQYDRVTIDGGIRHVYKLQVAYTDALIGYHWRFGELTAKAFVGIAAIEHVSVDGKSGAAGLEYGPKAMLELWLNLGQSQWTSLNLAYTTAHETASARWRWGFKLTPEMSVGPEVRFDTNTASVNRDYSFLDQSLGRAGLFLSYKWPSVEVSVAGGVGAHFAGTERDSERHELSPYGTLNMLYQF